MKNELELYLKQNGPCLTTELAAFLTRNGNVSPSAARQRIKRMPDTIKRLAFLPFPRNARFVYLRKDYGSPRFWQHLIAAFNETNSIYGAALGAVSARNGIVPEQHFAIICGAPTRQKKHVSSETVLERLLEANLLVRTHVEGLGPCIVLPQNDEFLEISAMDVRSRLLGEDLLLSAVAAWTRKNGFVSYGRVLTRSLEKAPDAGTAVWDLVGPCYLNGILPKAVKDRKQRPAFLVVDILNERVGVHDVTAFVRKCETVRQLSQVTYLQMFVSVGYTKDARDLLKSKGIIAATAKSLFGKDFQAALKELQTFFRHIIATSSIDIEKLDYLLSRFRDIEGASQQIRGTLFEFIAAKMAAYEFRSDTVHLNRVYVDPISVKKRAEADLTIEGGRTLHFIECKGTAPYGIVPHEQFQKWIQEQVATIYAVTRNRPEWANRDITFEFWATAPLSEESQALYDRVTEGLNTNRYNLRVRLGGELAAICESMGDESVINAFNKHFVDRGRSIEGPFSG